MLGGDENLREAHAVAAASNLPTGPGGVFERFTRTALGIPSFAYATSRRAGGPALAPSDFETDGAWIDYRGGPGTIRTVSFSDLVRGRIDPAVFRGKIVVVGATSPSLQDVHATPTASDDLMSGPEIQANAIWTATRALPLRSAPLWFDILAIIALAMAPALAGLRARPLAVALVAPLVGVFWLILAQLAFGAGWIVAVIWPLAALLMGTTGTIAARYLAELTERRRVTLYSEVLERRVRERTEELRETQLEVVRRLAQAAESRDGDTGAHIERMSLLCERLARQIGWSVADAELLRHASALHDVGKIGIPDRVLLKPGKLDREEREIMKRHASIGAAMLSDSPSELLQLAEDDRPHPPRALGRRRLPGGACGRGDPARRAHLRGRATSTTRSCRRARTRIRGASATRSPRSSRCAAGTSTRSSSRRSSCSGRRTSGRRSTPRPSPAAAR